MPLPTEKTKAITDIGKLSILIYGSPKIGKSTFASQFPNALFIATEPGLNHLEVFQMPVSTWDEFLAVCADIAKGEHTFKTIVIDTIDNAYKLCADYICAKEKIRHEGDLEYGKAYAFIRAELNRVLWKLAHLGYGLILVSHAVDKEIKTRTGKQIKTTPTLPESAVKMIISFVDIICYIDTEDETDETGTVKNTRRVIHTKPNTYYIAGDRTGRLPETIELSYDAFSKAFMPKEEPKQEGETNAL